MQKQRQIDIALEQMRVPLVREITAPADRDNLNRPCRNVDQLVAGASRHLPVMNYPPPHIRKRVPFKTSDDDEGEPRILDEQGRYAQQLPPER